MCGRITLKAPVHQIAAAFQVAEEPPPELDLGPRYNIAPTQPVLAVLARPTDGRALRLLQWGLIPPWSRDRGLGARMFNARSETVQQKPAFREAFARRRCLVPVDGFYEWEKKGRERLPHYFFGHDGGPLALAGLWQRWEVPGGEVIESCSLLTCEANALMRRIHHRMPVILDPQHHEDWLTAPPEAADRLLALLAPGADDTLRAHRVAKLVNRTASDGPELIEPVHDEPPGQLGLFG